jgi:hypothetical protein
MFGIPKLWQIRNIVKEEVSVALGTGEDSIKEVRLARAEADKLRREIADLEHKKGLEEKEITHLVKMKEEKILIDTKKKELELQERFMKDTAELQKKFHESTVALLEKHSEKFQHTYEEIMKRLPNVNVDITRGGGHGNG